MRGLFERIEFTPTWVEFKRSRLNAGGKEGCMTTGEEVSVEMSSSSGESFPMSPLFRVHRLNEVGLRKAEAIAEVFNRCLFDLQSVCAEGREFSIVKTKLEEAAFFAKKSMANVRENQQ